MITAIPHAGYDPDRYRLKPAKRVRTAEDGDIVDTGDRSFEVMHLPGTSPGSMGLWEKSTGTLFSGDALYDGPLLDQSRWLQCAGLSSTDGAPARATGSCRARRPRSQLRPRAHAELIEGYIASRT
jgi:glyoxylase-like metal-dependent hydrolase (beta-lactamase superfamily II)